MTREDKLFHASVAAMQGIVSNQDQIDELSSWAKKYEQSLDGTIAGASKNLAKALLAELDKEGGE